MLTLTQRTCASSAATARERPWLHNPSSHRLCATLLSACRSTLALVSYQALRPGQYLYAQGDPATAFYVLLKGACQVMVNRKVVRGSEDRPSERDNVSERRKSSTTELMEARASHAGATRGRGFFRNNTKAEWENSSVPLEGVGPLRQVGEPIGYAPLVVGQPTRLTGMQAIEPTLFLMVDKVHFERAMEAHTTTLKPCVLRMTLNNVLNRYALEPTSFFHAFQEEEVCRAASHPHAHGDSEARPAGGARWLHAPRPRAGAVTPSPPDALTHARSSPPRADRTRGDPCDLVEDQGGRDRVQSRRSRKGLLLCLARRGAPFKRPLRMTPPRSVPALRRLHMASSEWPWSHLPPPLSFIVSQRLQGHGATCR